MRSMNRTPVWTRLVGGFGVAAVLSALVGCASTPPEDPAVANLPRTQVTGEALRTLIVGQRMSSVRMGFLVQADFRADGIVFGRVATGFGNAADQGRWWISDRHEVCLQWPGRFSPNNGCFTVEQRTDGALFGRESANPNSVQRINVGAIQPGS